MYHYNWQDATDRPDLCVIQTSCFKAPEQNTHIYYKNDRKM